MKKTTLPQKTALDTILEWSMDRPAWQRDALRRIVTKHDLDNNDFDQLRDLCRQDKGEAITPALTPIPLETVHLPANPIQEHSVSLCSIFEVNGVNNLAAEQTLSFEPNGITIIYGDNGAGKSGYARILKRACRARHPGNIEPNVYCDQQPQNASAAITYSVGGVLQPKEKWQNSERPHSILSAVSVFDSDCASVHIQRKNEVAFQPLGLDVPDKLAEVCQVLKNKFTDDQKQLEKTRDPMFSMPTWKAYTRVGKKLSNLRHDTNINEFHTLANLTIEESTRLELLREDISKNPAKAAAEQTKLANNIKRLIDAIDTIATKTNDQALTQVADLVKDAQLKQRTADIAAKQAFSTEPLDGIGSEIWHILWNSAKHYSTEIAYQGKPFPPLEEGMHCVLCLQPLETEARARMKRFEDFIQKDTEQQAQEAKQVAIKARQSLSNVVIGTQALKINLNEINLSPELLRQTRRFIAKARLQRFKLMKALEIEQVFNLSPLVIPSPIDELCQLETTVRKYTEELSKSADTEERKKLNAEFDELHDRASLNANSMMLIIESELQRLKKIQFLTKCTEDTATSAITKLGNDIADMIITPKLRDRFQEEIIKLSSEKVRVEIIRSGGKYGSPQYQVRLFSKPEAKVHEILSEGEKTCVALAAFMTELATATHSSTLVFDDPISSLDHKWRQKVAKRLIEEAEHRQIIIFTHDTVFVHDLHDHADKMKQSVGLITISRGPGGAGMVAKGLPWKGKNIKDRISKLENEARDAKKLYENNQDDDYQKKAAQIYSLLRASWERALEEIAFCRVVQRHRDYINPKDLKKVSVLTENDCDTFETGYKKCCDFTNAHDPAGGRNASSPPPDEILQDVQALRNWANSLRERQKSIQQNK